MFVKFGNVLINLDFVRHIEEVDGKTIIFHFDNATVNLTNEDGKSDIDLLVNNMRNAKMIL